MITSLWHGWNGHCNSGLSLPCSQVVPMALISSEHPPANLGLPVLQRSISYWTSSSAGNQINFSTVQSNPITTSQPRLNPSLEEEAWFPSWFPFWGRFPQRQASLTVLIMLLSLISVKDSNSLNILCSNYKNVSVFGLHPDSYKIFIMSDSGE